MLGESGNIAAVPGIAIRGGVMKPIEMAQGHFMEIYGIKARILSTNHRIPNSLACFRRTPATFAEPVKIASHGSVSFPGLPQTKKRRQAGCLLLR